MILATPCHKTFLYIFALIDLKKTMAVLLDNIMERLDKLEKRVNMVLENSTINTRQLMQEGVQVNLSIQLN